MSDEDVVTLIKGLTAQNRENEWVEFKHNNDSPLTLAKNVSALANAACLHEKEEAFLVFGVEDDHKSIVGTTFNPETAKIQGQELENWLTTQLDPKVAFNFFRVQSDSKWVVVCIIESAKVYPVKFNGQAYIRVGSYTKPLNKHPEKERALWKKLNSIKFESGLAYKCSGEDEALDLIDYVSFFRLMDIPLPADKAAIVDRLIEEKILQKKYNKLQVTNLGAILFASDISKFEDLSRKAMRVIFYQGHNRVSAASSDLLGGKGYAAGFQGLINYISNRLPQNEYIEEALRRNEKLYPLIAIREIVANALIHQDFSITGSGPIVEVFDNRIEVTNPGTPLIPTDRFIDHAPTSRNEKLAFMMRRAKVCEERGSGIDRVVENCEVFQLPAPEFIQERDYTRVIVYAPKLLREMSKEDKLRAAYQHCSLMYVSNQGLMTNATFRKRLNIEDKNYPVASKIIAEAISAGLIKPFDPTLKANKHQKYLPYWG